MRSVITKVLPVPAPAIINSGPALCSMADFCSVFEDVEFLLEAYEVFEVSSGLSGFFR